MLTVEGYFIAFSTRKDVVEVGRKPAERGVVQFPCVGQGRKPLSALACTQCQDHLSPVL